MTLSRQTTTVNSRNEAQSGMEIKEADEFRHEPLNSRSREFRLLNVLPGKDHDDIHCEIRKASFDEEPTYTALSYTWESSYVEEPSHIRCAGKIMRIRSNLWHFLYEFRNRKTYQSVSLWVDAISIDQSNIQERNHQVAQMYDIYSKASSVIVWLGQSLDDEWLAFDRVAEGSRRLEFLSGDDLPHLRLHGAPKQWLALEALLNKPYWERQWIIQEFLLACNVTIWCGSHSTEWAAFERIFESLDGSTKSHLWRYHEPSDLILESRASVLWRQRSSWWRMQAKVGQRRGNELVEMLLVHAASKSTDRRDKVYSLLGLARDCCVKADYAKSNVEVLIDVLRDHYQWQSTSQIEASQSMITNLKNVLRVSSAELAWYVCQHAPDLQPFLRPSAIEDRVYNPLRYVGTILGLDFNNNLEGLTSKVTLFRSLLRRSRNDPSQVIRPFISPELLSYHAAAAINGLGSNSDSLAVLDADVIRFTHCAVALRDTNDASKVCPDGKEPYKIQQECRSHDTDISRESSIQLQEIVDQSRILVATDGIVGLTKSLTARPGDLVYALEGTQCNSIAVILQNYSHSILGTAKFATLGFDATDSALPEPALPNFDARILNNHILHITYPYANIICSPFPPSSNESLTINISVYPRKPRLTIPIFTDAQEKVEHRSRCPFLHQRFPIQTHHYIATCGPWTNTH